MAKIAADLEAKINAAPTKTFDLIIKTQGEVAPHLDWLAAAGIKVTRQFRLTPGAAITCAGAAAQKLLGQPWVVSVELDQPVSAF